MIDAAEVIKVEHSHDGCAVVMICKTGVIVAVDGDGMVRFTRQELLSMAASIPADTPQHLTTTAPFVECDRCGRKSYNALELQACGGFRTGEAPCQGLFRKPSKGGLYPKPHGV